VLLTHGVLGVMDLVRRVPDKSWGGAVWTPSGVMDVTIKWPLES
jgi:hypothetical protein